MSRPDKASRPASPKILDRNSYALAKSGCTEAEADLFAFAQGAAPAATEPASRVRSASSPDSDLTFSDQFLTDRDVAKRYRVQKQTIWRWAKSSATFPKPFKIEGTTRWSSKELDEHDRRVKEARR